ncbi:SIMPL domain-containing protein [Actinoplanes sp. G11-F43]|uniref:SIMPL domain-containing protein n=1 Tax=Actinoplanes sp. G11-F43 TaxID=3424130 RepID=UPI003D344248
MIERPWGVTAYGAASVKSKPELVRTQFRVVRLEQTPSDAFAAANEAVRAVRQTLRRHDVPDSAVERSRLDLTSSWDGYGPNRKFLGYRCQAAFVVETGNLEDIQQLLVDIVAAGANEIESVDFDVAGKGEMRAEARRRAVAAARRKAELYAEAAGVRLGPVVHIEDVDPDRVGNERYRGHGSGGAASGEDLAPGHVVVSAAVTLGFALTHD